MEGDFKIRGLGGCLFPSTVFIKYGPLCVYSISVYGCPSYYFLLVLVVTLHVCKQLCSSTAVLPPRPYVPPSQEKIPQGTLTAQPREGATAMPKIKNKK